MKIAYASRKLEKLAQTEKELVRELGADVAKAFKNRLAFMLAAPNLDAIPTELPHKRHLLTGNRKGQWSITVRNGICICVKPDHDPEPLKDDGGVDLRQVTAVEIVFIGDYHK